MYRMKRVARAPERLSIIQNAGRILYKCEIPLHSISLHIFRNYVIPSSEWMSPLFLSFCVLAAAAAAAVAAAVPSYHAHAMVKFVSQSTSKLFDRGK